MDGPSIPDGFPRGGLKERCRMREDDDCDTAINDVPDELRLKSILILGGKVKVPARFSHPDAEPNGDGTGAFILSFGGSRISKKYSETEGEFELSFNGPGFSLSKDGALLAKDVGIVKRHSHSPFQANVKLDPAVPKEEMMGGLQRIMDTGTVRGISAGIAKDAGLDFCVESVRRIREAWPDIPIGLRYRPCSKDDLAKLKEAGVDELKLNIGSTVPRISAYLDEGQDMDGIVRCLEDAVEVFGRGRVATTLYAGLGETDEEIEGCMRAMASRGVLSDLKLKKIPPKDAERARSMLGEIPRTDAERLARLGMMLKAIESEQGLDSGTFKTLCIACRCCNLVPFLDF